MLSSSDKCFTRKSLSVWCEVRTVGMQVPGAKCAHCEIVGFTKSWRSILLKGGNPILSHSKQYRPSDRIKHKIASGSVYFATSIHVKPGTGHVNVENEVGRLKSLTKY